MTTVLLIAIMAATAAPETPVFGAEVIFEPVQRHSHSSSIVETPEGDLLACWFHGRGERSDDSLVIEGARKRKGAKDPDTKNTWSEPFIMADNFGLPDQNPVLFIDPSETLWLFWISSQDNERETYLLKYRTATKYTKDGPPEWDWNDVLHCRPTNLETMPDKVAAMVDDQYGASFDSEPKYRERLAHAQECAKEKIWRRLGWMPRCQPIMLSENRMMLGLYSDIFMTSYAVFTEDGGKTWEYGEPVVGYGLIQPSFVQKKDGTIVAYGRDKGPSKRIRVAESADGGMTWSPVSDMDIPNPDSSVCCIVLDNGNWLLVCNDLDGKERHGRSRMTAYLSEDEGATWPWRRAIEDNPDAPDMPENDRCHASYPTVIQTSNGMVHCTYTYSPKPNETIKHVWFNEAWVRAGD